VKTAILLDKELKTNLNKAIIEFKDTATTLDLVLFEKNNTDERKIAAINTRGSNRRGGYRGGYRGGGRHNHTHRQSPYHRNTDYRRGGYQGRGGRGGTASSGGRGDTSEKEDDGLLLDQSILDQMSSKQRKAYYEGRSKLRSSDDNQTARSEIPRNIGAVQTDVADDDSKITSASAAFGRHSS